MSAESRVHPRLQLKVLADVIGREVMLNLQLQDISLGGCKLAGPAWEELGTEVELLLSFADSKTPLPLRGEVVRSRAKDMGVRFIELNDDQKWALRKSLRESQ